jgi:hypothetical protein
MGILRRNIARAGAAAALFGVVVAAHGPARAQSADERAVALD